MSLTIVDGTDYGRASLPVKAKVIKITGDSSYPTGGEDFDLTEYLPDGYTLIAFATIPHIAGGAAAAKSTLQYDSVNGKVLAYDSSGEISNATNLSTYVWDVLLLWY